MVSNWLTTYWNELVALTLEMAPYLLLGFIIAGIFHVWFPSKHIERFLGRPNLRSVVNATLLGIPLPLCSCGVIPTGISLYKDGASKGGAVSFLISTPQTGVDSILVTYSLLGWPFALIRPVVAFVTGILGGALTNVTSDHVGAPANSVSISSTPREHALKRMWNYAFVEFMEDIAKWLIIGLMLAALIAVAIPNGFFEHPYLSNTYLNMGVILLASIPLYVCATGSVPIAAVLLMKGLSPGAALVFLMAGPATNIATITVISKSMGKRVMITYLTSIIVGAMAFGILIDELIPRSWILGSIMAGDHHGAHWMPEWLKAASAIGMILLIANVYRRKLLRKSNTNTQSITSMNQTQINVGGMTCNHCKANVENRLERLDGIEKAEVNLERATVALTGKDIDLEAVEQSVKEIGYEYRGSGH